MDKKELLRNIRRLKPELESKFGVRRIGFFEDFIDRTHTENCEVNILVEFEKPLGWKFFELKEWLQYKLKMRIDICTPRSLKPALKSEIMDQTQFA